MSGDSPIQTVLQQRDARPVSGEHLEVLGKQAAANWCEGKVASLHAAIVDVVRGERLSPEQVKRVVEFTNGDAYLQEFRKEGSHKVVHFDCGPADPSQVLQDLNDGGGGSVYDRGTLDYTRDPKEVHKHAQASSYREQVADFYAGRGGTPTATSPRQRVMDFYSGRSVTHSSEASGAEKTASVEGVEPVEGLPKLPKMPALPKHAAVESPYEDQLWALFNNGEPSHIAFAEPLQPLVEVRSKLAAGRDQVASEIDALEIDYATAGDQLYHHVKQAALEGVSLADVVKSWSSVSDDPLYVKIAFRLMTPRFQREGVFPSLDALGESLTKQASAGDVNVEHPLVSSYGEFIDALNKLANMRVLHQEFVDGFENAESLLKQAASGGLIGAAKKGIGAASQGIDAASPAIAQFLVGAQDAKQLAPTISKGLKGTALVGGALAGNAALQSVTDRPLVQAGLGAAKAVVPGTAEYQNRRYRTMTGQ